MTNHFYDLSPFGEPYPERQWNLDNSNPGGSGDMVKQNETVGREDESSREGSLPYDVFDAFPASTDSSPGYGHTERRALSLESDNSQEMQRARNERGHASDSRSAYDYFMAEDDQLNPKTDDMVDRKRQKHSAWAEYMHRMGNRVQDWPRRRSSDPPKSPQPLKKLYTEIMVNMKLLPAVVLLRNADDGTSISDAAKYATDALEWAVQASADRALEGKCCFYLGYAHYLLGIPAPSRGKPKPRGLVWFEKALEAEGTYAEGDWAWLWMEYLDRVWTGKTDPSRPPRMEGVPSSEEGGSSVIYPAEGERIPSFDSQESYASASIPCASPARQRMRLSTSSDEALQTRRASKIPSKEATASGGIPARSYTEGEERGDSGIVFTQRSPEQVSATKVPMSTSDPSKIQIHDFAHPTAELPTESERPGASRSTVAHGSQTWKPMDLGIEVFQCLSPEDMQFTDTDSSPTLQRPSSPDRQQPRQNTVPRPPTTPRTVSSPADEHVSGSHDVTASYKETHNRRSKSLTGTAAAPSLSALPSEDQDTVAAAAPAHPEDHTGQDESLHA